MSERQLVLPRAGINACPFCGSNDVRLGTYGGMYVAGHRVHCMDCHAHGPETPYYTDKDGEQAWVAWNRRATV